ncbi:hypothetical protein [Shinella granuli]|uniref:hypothetical protein n=1 Tax=Shinella granuli TaxID=323621 RepID=UPI0031EF81B9
MLKLSSTMVDRIARRPGGLLGYLLYRFPLGHKIGFDLALRRLPPEGTISSWRSVAAVASSCAGC